MSRFSLFAYGFLALPLAMLGIPLYLYLPIYYHQTYDISLALIGAALLLARVTDVITDPFIGSLSDRWAARWPRKWQLVSGFALLLFGIYQLFFPQGFDGTATESITWLWLLSWSFVTYLGWTWVQVPYLTLAAEISKVDYEKTRLASVREGLAIVGVIGVLLLPLMLDQAIESIEFFQSLFIAFVVLLVLSGALIVQLKTLQAVSGTLIKRPLQALWQLKNQQPHLLKLFPIYFLNNLANALPASLFVFFVADYLQLEEHKGIFLLVYFLSGLVALPVWMWLSKRWVRPKLGVARCRWRG